MTPIQEIRRRLTPRLDRLNALMSEELRSGNQLMDTVIDGYLARRGKQLRPILVMLTAELMGTDGDNVIDAAASVEMLHNASLIHDDVVDDSDCRHGQPTINAVWANHIAVLVGDFFVSTSLHLALRTRDLRVMDVIGRLGRLLSIGEMDQIYNAREHTLTEEAYYRVIIHKTASLFEACVEMGCYCSGVEDDRLERMRDFARKLGCCFQIRDDIFDYYDSAEIGKPTGNDLREGKVTLPLIYALVMSGHERAPEMLALVEENRLGDEEISALVAFAKEADGIAYAEAELQRLHDEAVDILDTFPSSSAREDLRALIDYVVVRRS